MTEIDRLIQAMIEKDPSMAAGFAEEGCKLDDEVKVADRRDAR